MNIHQILTAFQPTSAQARYDPSRFGFSNTQAPGVVQTPGRRRAERLVRGEPGFVANLYAALTSRR